jgi:pyruvate ferredoxin oxidoreductase alpha subunit
MPAELHTHDRGGSVSRAFLSGNEAVAEAARLCRPAVIAAYPITPQTTVVERLAEMVDSGLLASRFVHVESEHSALSLVMGSAAMGLRTFTATSSQGLLYMAEILFYASGGRFPLVMMNANRALALPWNIYGDQSDSLALLHSGWIQAYAEDAQEALDMTVQAYAVAERRDVLTPVMVNLDGFFLTHTYEPVDIPAQGEVDAWLPLPDFPGVMGDPPLSLAMTAGPGDYAVFKRLQRDGMERAAVAIREESERFRAAFGRGGSGLAEGYRSEDADTVLVTLGSLSGLARDAVDELRSEGRKAGLVRIRYLRPFPADELTSLIGGARAIGVVEKALAIGGRSVVADELRASLYDLGGRIPLLGYVGGLGGQDIGTSQIRRIFDDLEAAASGSARPPLSMLDLEGFADGLA